jgi:alpha-D-ribose 1-methylphosphonate 5-triphosphate synthase subunit PhnL
MTAQTNLLRFEDVAKRFVLHLRGGSEIDVVAGVSFAAGPGECVVLGGPSGIGKSSILKMAYGNYHASAGRILVRDGEAAVDVTAAEPREILSLRNRVIGYVSQFLRVIPRVSALDIVATAAQGAGVGTREAVDRAEHVLALLNLPRQLWSLPPATFSGGEQQRVNIARGLVADRALLLLDEPTASLDARNRAVVVDLIREKKRRGVAIVGIFHDDDVRAAVADRIVDVTSFAPSRQPAESAEAAP